VVVPRRPLIVSGTTTGTRGVARKPNWVGCSNTYKCKRERAVSYKTSVVLFEVGVVSVEPRVTSEATKVIEGVGPFK